MGYGIVLVMKKSFEDSESFEGRVAYAKQFEKLTDDFVNEPYGTQYFEDFDEKYNEVCIRDDGSYNIRFFPNLIRVWTPLSWSVFFDWDDQPGSQRKEFQKFIDRIQPEECWVGTDYATDQVCDIEAGLEKWLESVIERCGSIDEFDFEKLREDKEKKIWPKDLYLVKDNKLYK